jgi:hypothetical protein
MRTGPDLRYLQIYAHSRAEIAMATSPEDREHVAAPSDWQGWQRWVEEVDDPGQP